MAQSLSKVYVHITFSTKNRLALIDNHGHEPQGKPWTLITPISRGYLSVGRLVKSSAFGGITFGERVVRLTNFSSLRSKNLSLTNKIETSLFEYIGGICKGLDCNPIKIGGHIDHVHVLTLLSRKISQMKLFEEIKKQSSKCPPAGRAGVKTKDIAYSNFYWQNGYGIFSVNPSEIDIVVNYISNQATHHTKLSFQDEFREFLKMYKVDYDERYVWD